MKNAINRPRGTRATESERDSHSAQHATAAVCIVQHAEQLLLHYSPANRLRGALTTPLQPAGQTTCSLLTNAMFL